VDASTFLGLEPTSDPLRWRLPVTPLVSSGMGALFGGCGLAAGVVALEEVTGRRTVWATAQYLRYAPAGSVLDLEVVVPITGHRVSQGRVIAHTEDGEEILTVTSALGDRPGMEDRTLATFPTVPPPERSPARVGRLRVANVFDRVEVRLARGRQLEELDGTPGDGRACFWARVTGALEPSAAWLAVLGDLVPNGLAQARGTPGGGNSLDNTIRVLHLVRSDWILCDIGIDGLARGFGHGWGHLWSQDGTLLATASQSVIARNWDERETARMSGRRPG
jgi:acyl-CoA thioesterase II